MVAVLPPPLEFGAVEYAATAGAIAVGVAMVFWGRLIGRGLIVLTGAAVGWIVGGNLPFDVNPIIVRATAVFALAMIGLVTARLVWSVLAAGVFAAVAGAIVWCHVFETLGEQLRPAFGGAATVPAYLEACGKYAWSALGVLWEHKIVATVTIICPCGAVPLIIALLRPRLATIFMTSLIGSTAVVGGAATILVKARPELWESVGKYHYIGAAVAAGLVFLVGLAFQYPRDIAAEKKKAHTEAEPPGKRGSSETD